MRTIQQKQQQQQQSQKEGYLLPGLSPENTTQYLGLLGMLHEVTVTEVSAVSCTVQTKPPSTQGPASS